MSKCIETWNTLWWNYPNYCLCFFILASIGFMIGSIVEFIKGSYCTFSSDQNYTYYGCNRNPELCDSRGCSHWYASTNTIT